MTDCTCAQATVKAHTISVMHKRYIGDDVGDRRIMQIIVV